MTAVSPFTANTDNLPDAAAPMPSIGTILRKAREERGEKIEYCAEILKIRRVYLDAIENNNWNELPDRVYAMGFVRSYANYLGLDGERVIAQLKSTQRGMTRKADLEMPRPIQDMPAPNKRIMAGAAIALLLVFAIWSWLTPRQMREPITPPPVPVTDVAPTPTSVVEPAAPPVATTAPAVTSNATPADPQIVIRVMSDSWVQIRGDNGQVILSRLLRKGESYQVPATGQARLTTGNLAGLQFDINGKTLPTITRTGVVVRDIPLSADRLNDLIKNNNAPTTVAPAAPVEPAAEETGD